ncbi:uncharacterized protein LOC120282946 [Dioscorea cayenensis subsp. rotundata]|uniref:Uncharacterized protein LOC120282946 n=1 Tax=Dioscorea cayennensis subsp. rotundata TaxID=55577 RepID=A0AB40D232_DIOCR|nr:uncharacterized protein LOC120282946 [Dioscorea cayenensis subsp. rotundata]
MPFGLSNAPATFQALMNTIFQFALRCFVLVFFDDILVYSPTWDRHLQDLEQLRGFLGLSGYYRRFIKHYATIAKPLTDLLRKDSFQWTDQAEDAFLHLKQAVTTAPILCLPDFSQPFIIETDALGSGKFKHYLVGQKFVIRTDQLSLRYLTTQAIQTPEQQKWLSKLLGFDFTIEYKPGKDNVVVDALSPVSGVSCVSCGGARRYYTLMLDLHINYIGLQCVNLSTSLSAVASYVNKLKSLIVDRLSKYGHFVPLREDFTSASVAEAFVAHVVKLHGVPKTIVSDRDKVFTSRFWQHLFCSMGTKLAMTSAYHPQFDGQSEALNKCLEQYLRCFSFENPSKWVDFLPWAEFSYNTAKQTSTCFSPFKVLYGCAPPQLLSYSVNDHDPSVVTAFLQQRDQILSHLKFNLSKAQARMKRLADTKRTELSFEIGEWVFVKLRPYKQHSVALRQNHNLSLRYFGLFRVKRNSAWVSQEDLIPLQQHYPSLDLGDKVSLNGWGNVIFPYIVKTKEGPIDQLMESNKGDSSPDTVRHPYARKKKIMGKEQGGSSDELEAITTTSKEPIAKRNVGERIKRVNQLYKDFVMG